MLLPEYRDPHAGRLDLFSAALSLVAVLAVIYGFKQIAAERCGLGSRCLPIARRAWRSAQRSCAGKRALADPLIDLELFRSPAFSAALAVNVLGFFIRRSRTFLFIAQYLQSVFGLLPACRPDYGDCRRRVAFIGGSHASHRRSCGAFTRRTSSPAGLLVSAVGLRPPDARRRASAALAMLVAGSVMFSLGPHAGGDAWRRTSSLSAAPPERAGAASGAIGDQRRARRGAWGSR